MDTRPALLDRRILGQLFNDPQAIRAFENLALNSADLADVMSAVQKIAVLTLALGDVFENERVVAGDGNISLTDGGAGSTLTFGLTNTGVTAGAYGSASTIPRVTVDAKGRITTASSLPLNSDNIAEGGTNLFFTIARARASVSAGTGINYSAGVISAKPAGTYGNPAGTLERASFTTYTAVTISNPPTQSEVQDISNAVQDVSRRLAALITDLKANGNLS